MRGAELVTETVIRRLCPVPTCRVWSGGSRRLRPVWPGGGRCVRSPGASTGPAGGAGRSAPRSALPWSAVGWRRRGAAQVLAQRRDRPDVSGGMLVPSHVEIPREYGNGPQPVAVGLSISTSWTGPRCQARGRRVSSARPRSGRGWRTRRPGRGRRPSARRGREPRGSPWATRRRTSRRRSCAAGSRTRRP